MNYRKLGKSGLPISELSLGSWVTFGNQIEDGTAEKLMDIAYDAGINFFDNAEVYASGKSEEVMGEILSRKNWSRDSYILSSKVFWGAGAEHPTQKGLHRKHVMEACHQALRRLRTDYLDLYFCHRPDKTTPIEETVWTMHNLITQGKILYWGTSEWSAQEIMEAHMFARQNHLIGPVVEQPQYNMLVRRKVEVEFSQIYKTVGLGTTIWSPLASGYLTGKYLEGVPEGSRLEREDLAGIASHVLTEKNRQRVAALQTLASDLDLSLPVLAVAWCLRNPQVSTVILGATKTSQLEENLKASEAIVKLTEDVMARIEDILDNAPKHPTY